MIRLIRYFKNIIKLFYFYVQTSFEIKKSKNMKLRVCQDSYNECRIQYIGELKRLVPPNWYYFKVLD